MTLAGRKKQLFEKAAAERKACCEWLNKFVVPGQPKFFTKDELRSMAIAELGVSKNSFDFAWIDVIETTGRNDWYEPLRGKRNRIRQ